MAGSRQTIRKSANRFAATFWILNQPSALGDPGARLMQSNWLHTRQLNGKNATRKPRNKARLNHEGTNCDGIGPFGNFYPSILMQTLPTSLQNRRGSNRISQRRQPSPLQVLQTDCPILQRGGGIRGFLKVDVPYPFCPLRFPSSSVYSM